jgi:hypothetical protein
VAVALDGADVARRSARSSGFRPVGRVARASEVERAFRPWPTTPRIREESLGGLETIEGPPRTERHPLSALRRGGVHVSTEVRCASSNAADPASGRALWVWQRAWESMDPLVLVRRASVITVRRKTYLPRDAVRVERPLPNGRGSVTSQAHHAGRRGPVSSGDKGARQTCSATI